MCIKRLFDILCSLMGLVILAPFLIIIALLVKLSSKGPVFFRQVRVGRFGRQFRIHKFRTMVVNAENFGLQITIGLDNRITLIGRFLRKTKLDELPQLIDVLYGDMSIVGPRPEVPKYVELYPLDIRDIVLSVRPGITDPASIKMIDENLILANSVDPEDAYINEIMPIKLDYAVRYVSFRSFKQDIVIILKTIYKIFSR